MKTSKRRTNLMWRGSWDTIPDRNKHARKHQRNNCVMFQKDFRGHRDWASVSILKSKRYQWTRTTTFVFYTHGWMQRGREGKGLRKQNSLRPWVVMTEETGAKAVRVTECLRNLQVNCRPAQCGQVTQRGAADNLWAHSWATGWQRECLVWAKLGEGTFRQVNFG